MPNRAIDRYEDAIVNVLDECDRGVDFIAACETESGYWPSLTSGRLKSLVEMWCAIGGVECPS